MRDGAGRRPGGEDAVDAGGTHLVVAFWVDEELEGGVQVTIGFADGTDIVRGIVQRFARHFVRRRYPLGDVNFSDGD